MKAATVIRATRDVVLFVAGLVGIAHETLGGLDRKALLILFAGMVGLPPIIRRDEAKGPHDESS